MESQTILEKSLSQICTLTNIILQFYADNEAHFVKIGRVSAVAFAVTIGVNKIYEAYFGPLRNIPGPFICKFMEIPSLVYDMPLGTRFKNVKAMHDKYGEVVRVGPKSISVSDKEMIKQVISQDDLQKGPAYSIFKKNRETIFNTRDKIFHKQRRKIVSTAFSIKYLNSLEPFMLSCTRSLIDQIEKEIAMTTDSEGYGTVNIWRLMTCLGLDVIGETAFGQTFNMIENGQHPVPTIISLRMKFGAFVFAYPFIAKLFLSGKTDPRLEKFLRDIYNKRKGQNYRNDILQSLINTQDAENPEDRLSTQEIIEETIIYLIAGSETTSNSIGFAIIELLRHPDKLAKLYAEIDSIPMEEGEAIFQHDQLKKLPYLNGVINETLRLDPVSAGGMQRYTTQGITLGSHLMLPKDITVTCNLYHAQLNEKYWANATQFKPERWIPGENEYDEQVNDFEAFFPFSSGSRNCIGKNFALKEMRIALATLLKHYNIASIKKEMEDSKNLRQYITLQVTKNSFHVKIKRR